MEDDGSGEAGVSEVESEVVEVGSGTTDVETGVSAVEGGAGLVVTSEVEEVGSTSLAVVEKLMDQSSQLL